LPSAFRLHRWQLHEGGERPSSELWLDRLPIELICHVRRRRQSDFARLARLLTDLVGGASKSQIQALDRTQPGLPLKKGRAGTMTHD
jgi:transposase